MNLATFYDDYFYPDRATYASPATLTYYDDCIKNCFFRWIDPSTEISTLDRFVYRDYVLYLRTKNISTVSIRTYARGVRVFLNYLSVIGIRVDIMTKVRTPKAVPRMIVPLTQDEVMRIDRCFDTDTEKGYRNYIIVHLMLDCGLRRGEVVGLRPSNYDSKRQLIFITKTKSKSGRIVPVPDALADKLNRFPNLLITENAVKLVIQKLKIASNIPRLHAHLLRHTFATSFIYYGYGDVLQLRLLLGHEEISTTERYIHLADYYAYAHETDTIYKISDAFRRNLRK